MKDFEEKIDYDLTVEVQESIMKCINISYFAGLIKNHIMENLLIGQMHPGDKIDLQACYIELHLEPSEDDQNYLNTYFANYYNHYFIRNHFIVNHSGHYFEDICFRSKHNAFFEKRLNAIDYGYEKNYFYYYSETLRKLFFQVVKTPISKPELTLSTQQYDIVYSVSKNLLNNIIFKQLKQGTIINNYIRSLCLVPLYLTKLFRYDNATANYILTNDDIFSLDFELAIVGSLPWTTAKNATIMQAKINQWYKNYLAKKA